MVPELVDLLLPGSEGLGTRPQQLISVPDGRAAYYCPRMTCPHSALACATANVPATAWWLSMLQIFVPVGSALGLALIGYRCTLRSDLQAKGTEARLAIQRQALEDAQHALMTFWVSAAKLLRYALPERLEKKELLSRLEEASSAATVAYSRLLDRQLADNVAEWQHSTSLLLQSPEALSSPEVNAEHADFVALCDRLGERLRELTAVEPMPQHV
jgi:hypothetical protein